MRKGLLIILFLAIPLLLFGNQQITRIGVIDISKVAETYFKQSQAYRDLEKAAKEVQDKISAIQEELKALEKKKLAAKDAKDEALELELGNEIFKKTEYLKDYKRVKGNELNQRKQELSKSENFHKELIVAIKQVAELEGYSIVLDKTQNTIWYYAIEVDITDAVIKLLM